MKKGKLGRSKRVCEPALPVSPLPIRSLALFPRRDIWNVW